jgi:hypothetical protein
MRFIAGLVSEKVVKIGLAIDRFGHRPESKRPLSNPQTKSEVLNRINGSAELYDDQPFLKLRQSRNCSLIRWITLELVGIFTC